MIPGCKSSADTGGPTARRKPQANLTAEAISEGFGRKTNEPLNWIRLLAVALVTQCFARKTNFNANSERISPVIRSTVRISEPILEALDAFLLRAVVTAEEL